MLGSEIVYVFSFYMCHLERCSVSHIVMKKVSGIHWIWIFSDTHTKSEQCP